MQRLTGGGIVAEPARRNHARGQVAGEHLPNFKLFQPKRSLPSAHAEPGGGLASISHWCLPLNSVAKPSQPGAKPGMGSRPSALPRKRRIKLEKTKRREKPATGQKRERRHRYLNSVSISPWSQPFCRGIFPNWRRGSTVNSSFLFATRFVFATTPWPLRHMEVPAWTLLRGAMNTSSRIFGHSEGKISESADFGQGRSQSGRSSDHPLRDYPDSWETKRRVWSSETRPTNFGRFMVGLRPPRFAWCPSTTTTASRTANPIGYRRPARTKLQGMHLGSFPRLESRANKPPDRVELPVCPATLLDKRRFFSFFLRSNLAIRAVQFAKGS